MYHNVLICMHHDIISLFMFCIWMKLMQRKMQVWTFHSGRVTCVLVMILKLDQNNKHAKWEIYEFQKCAFIWIYCDFDGTSSVWVQSLLNTFERIMARPRFIVRYLFELNVPMLFHPNAFTQSQTRSDFLKVTQW